MVLFGEPIFYPFSAEDLFSAHCGEDMYNNDGNSYCYHWDPADDLEAFQFSCYIWDLDPAEEAEWQEETF